MSENYKNPKIRGEIKKRLIGELSIPLLPLHCQYEIKSALYEIDCFEKRSEK